MGSLAAGEGGANTATRAAGGLGGRAPRRSGLAPRPAHTQRRRDLVRAATLTLARRTLLRTAFRVGLPADDARADCRAFAPRALAFDVAAFRNPALVRDLLRALATAFFFGFTRAAARPALALVLVSAFAFALAFALRRPSALAIAEPSSAGERTVVTRAASSAANLSAAVPLPPEMTAPAWPMRLPGGAVTPAM